MRSFWRVRVAFQYIKETVCLHKYKEPYSLIFGGGRNTHNLCSRCIKCGKEHTKFKGTRREYREYVGLKQEDGK